MRAYFQTSASKIIFFHTSAFLVLLVVAALGVYEFESRYIDTESKAILEMRRLELREIFEQKGPQALREEVQKADFSQKKPPGSLYHLISSDSGEKIAGLLDRWPPDFWAPESPKLLWTTPEFLAPTTADDPTYWPAVTTSLPDGSRLLVARHRELGEEIREVAFPTLGLTLLLALLGSISMAFSLSRSLLRKVDEVNDAIEIYEQGDLTKRIPDQDSHDEFRRLSRHLNSLFDHVEKLIVGMKRVTLDVAHDMRSPLTRIKTRIEVTLLEERSCQEYRTVLDESLQDISRLVETFNSLLYLGKIEAQKEPFSKSQVDLGSLLEKTGSLFQGEESALTIETQENCVILGNKDLLQRLLSNLLENALKFSPKKGTVESRVFREENSCILEVCDRGPGIQKEKRDLVLQRFYRDDTARSTPGNGLGLSLVKAVVDNHDGELLLEDNEPGLRVRVKFDLA